MDVYVENVLRHLEQLSYDDYLTIDRAILDESCKYVYNTIERGFHKPLDEVTLNITYKNKNI